MSKVSIIIPNYNHARYLRQRIDSVLGQTYQDFEVILLDDCSTDESRSIVSEYANDPRVRLEFNEENSGSSFKQWNKGVRLARGEYVWIAESDDYADTRFLERLVVVLEGEPENSFVYCRSWRVAADGRASGFADPELSTSVRQRWTADYSADGRTECRTYMIYCNTVPNASAVLFRKTTYERVGGADESLRLCGDWKLWASMAMRGRIAYVAEPLNYYRSHDESVSNRSKGTGVWTTEGYEIGQWIRLQFEIPAEYWVPALMSLHTPLRAKREMLRRALQADPHALRNALGPALLAVRLKFFRYWKELLSVIRAVRSESAVRAAIVRSKMAATGPRDWFAGIDEEAWFWMNTGGRRRRKAIEELVPGMPKVSLQENYTGGSGDETLRTGFDAYRLFKNCYEKYVGPIGACPAILDFGCGWGRILRFFLKDIEPEKLCGVDQSAEAVQVCRETNKWCRFTLIGAHPPTPLEAESFGLIYLYSVFSHLPEEMHWTLLREFHRLLVPGGMLIATTRARDYIHFCKNLREDARLDEKPLWLRQSASAFANAEAAISDYDNGQFCYANLGDVNWPFWGEACIPKGYVERRWREIFDVCEYIDDPELCPQNVIVARKRVPVRGAQDQLIGLESERANCNRER
jgi:GT2 family glycosyltransferase/SAM-dependent methyltransferase